MIAITLLSTLERVSLKTAQYVARKKLMRKHYDEYRKLYLEIKPQLTGLHICAKAQHLILTELTHRYPEEYQVLRQEAIQLGYLRTHGVGTKARKKVNDK